MPFLFHKCNNIKLCTIFNLTFLRHFENIHLSISECHQNNENKNDFKEIASKIVMDYPEEPTTCCMSGCANCVWLEYAEKLNNYYKDGGDKARKEIEEKVTDPNIKAFLLHELRMRKNS